MSDCGCKSNCKPCGSTKGERGLQGLTGPQGEPGPAGPAGGGIVNKINFFNELTSEVVVNEATFYHPTGYDVLSYTNTSGATKVFAVHATVQARMNLSNSDDVENEVQAAIIKTVSGVDTYSHILNLHVDLRGGLFDELAPGNTPLRITTPLAPRQVTTDEGNPVEFRFGQAYLDQAGALLAKVTLNNNETVTVKYKNKGGDTLLEAAQIFVQELDQ